jgi:hypothetical protein
VTVNVIHNIIHGLGLFITYLIYNRKKFAPYIIALYKFIKSKSSNFKKPKTMKYLVSIIIPVFEALLTMFGKKITVSAATQALLKDLQNIADNLDNVAQGNYTFASTGNLIFDGIEKEVIDYIQEQYAKNKTAVEQEIAGLIEAITPLIDQFVSETQIANGPPPPDSQAAKPTFLQEALGWIENILGMENKSGSVELQKAQQHANNAKFLIEKHIAATPAPTQPIAKSVQAK